MYNYAKAQPKKNSYFSATRAPMAATMKQAKMSPCGGERSAVLSAGVQSKMKAYMAPW